MRIVAVSAYFEGHRGGIETVVSRLASRLPAAGVEVIWFASQENHAYPASEAFERRPLKSWNVTERWLGFPFPLWGPAGLLRLYRGIRGADLVHLHDSLYFGNFIAFLISRWLKKPLVVTQHIGLVPYRNPVLRALLSLANRFVGGTVLSRADQVIFISRSVASYFSELVSFKRPPEFLPNGVDTVQFSPGDEQGRDQTRHRLGFADPRKPLLLFVGRFTEKKGLHLIRAVASASDSANWAFIGWGTMDPALWNLPNVKCIGSVNQSKIAPYYRAADLLVLPSRGEGFPLVVQEAMACGLPALIASETALAIPDIKGAIFVCEPEARSLNSVVEEICKDLPGLRAKGASALSFARAHWSIESWTQRHVSLYQAVAGRPAAQAA